MSEELKPCPFCGGEGNVIERINPMSKWRWSVDCTTTTCGMSGPVEANKADAIAAWNTRTTDARITSLEEENKRLREALSGALGALGALEQDLDAGRAYGDADWEGIAFQRLQAAQSALSIRGEG